MNIGVFNTSFTNGSIVFIVEILTRASRMVNSQFRGKPFNTYDGSSVESGIAYRMVKEYCEK